MPSTSTSRAVAARPAPPLSGEAPVPGDKSISHRALLLGTLAVGETRISGLLEAEDVLNTASAMRAYGATVERQGPGLWSVHGVGVGGLTAPAAPLDFGNSGTGSRLVMGMAATTPVTSVFTGDSSLRRRPMKRVLDPLTRFGARYEAQPGGLMPLSLTGAGPALAIDYEVTVASAQVKSALLFAALNATGRSRIGQRALTRDHTEKMLAAFGADISVEPRSGGGEVISLMGEAELSPCAVDVPRDPSSAAFPLVAGLLVPGSVVSAPGVLLNTRRTGEDIGDIAVRFSALKGIEVPPEGAPAMIDEYPVLAVAAAFAEGRTVMRGLEELRVKESDRLSAIVAGLRANGVTVEELEDGLIVEGRGADGVPGGGMVETHMDHRIAMSFLVMGMAARAPVAVDDVAMIATSFPEFEGLMRGLGAELLSQ